MPDVNSNVQYIRGIGEQRARALGRLGIRTLGDLIRFFPRAYEDRTVFRSIASLVPEETACVRAMVVSEPRLSRIRRGLELVKLRVVDDSGSLDITFFNQSYTRQQLHTGESYVFYGRIQGNMLRKSMVNPQFEPESAAGTLTGRIVPVYRLTAGVSQKLLIGAVRSGLEACGDILPEPLPEKIRTRYALAGLGFSCRNIHFPGDYEALRLARRRLIFEELFVLACSMAFLRKGRERASGLCLQSFPAEEFFSALPFSPTGAQRRAVAEAFEDMCSGRAMSRLLQGDVGSGKTLVAAACIWLCWKNGLQCAFMAPTEILVDQHFGTFTEFFAPFGLRVGRLTGSMTAAQKRGVKELLATGELDLLVGTHALLSGDVAFRSPALVVTDEQHRFGVAQRAALQEKGTRPHVLVMSATPIPRTLALIIYGELDVSVLDELPPGRQRVDTFAVDSSLRPRLYAFIRRLVAEGRQVFVVCPRIGEDEEAPDMVSAGEMQRRLRDEIFPELRVGCIHGRLRPKDKEAEMARFVAGELDILVATTVVEVGVDVPNAALMVVEGAERFGLSQLHQLRGRVGRGAHKSYCVLVSDAGNEEARARLGAMCRIADGFAIAEEDLRLRGPGDFFGSRQHGLPELHIADLCSDMDLLQSAQTAANQLLAEDPELSLPEHRVLRERVSRFCKAAGDTFN